MVLRRPYAFLIKHFRLIHLIITALFAYLAIRTRDIYVYLNSVIEASTNRYSAPDYINYGLLIFVVLSLILCYVIHWLLKYKDKPRRIYEITIIGYIIIAVFILMLFGYMRGFTSEIVDNKTIRFYRDTLSIMQLFQYIIVLAMGVRGLGFDIKKFDFGKDVQELNATASDSEEVEINTQIDTTNIMRRINKSSREFGYFYKEFKGYIITIIVIVVLFLGFKGYNWYKDKFKVYSENQYVGLNNMISITDSYYDIADNNYVILKFDAFRNGRKEQLNVNNIALYIDKNKYLPDKTICYKYNSLGNCYKKQYISNETSNYILTYKVDKFNIKKAFVMYTDSFDEVYKIKLSMEELN